jgi:hypothetical protein
MNVTRIERFLYRVINPLLEAWAEILLSLPPPGGGGNISAHAFCDYKVYTYVWDFTRRLLCKSPYKRLIIRI